MSTVCRKMSKEIGTTYHRLDSKRTVNGNEVGNGTERLCGLLSYISALLNVLILSPTDST